jgi:hypothetical protein
MHILPIIKQVVIERERDRDGNIFLLDKSAPIEKSIQAKLKRMISLSPY